LEHNFKAASIRIIVNVLRKSHIDSVTLHRDVQLITLFEIQEFFLEEFFFALKLFVLSLSLFEKSNELKGRLISFVKLVFDVEDVIGGSQLFVL
jgi:hypothetical protein